MNENIRIGLKGVKQLEQELKNAKSQFEIMDVHLRLYNLMRCVLDEVMKEIGEREGEGRHMETSKTSLSRVPMRDSDS